MGLYFQMIGIREHYCGKFGSREAGMVLEQ